MKLILLALLPLAYVQADHREPERQTRYYTALELIQDRSRPEDIPILKDDPNPLRLRLDLQLRALDARDNLMQLTVVEKMSYRDPNLDLESSHPGVNLKNVSTPREYLWIPDLELANSAEPPQRASPARAVVSEKGMIRYEPLRINAVPSVSPKLMPAGVNVSLEYKSTSYRAKDLIFEQPLENSLDLSEYKSIGYVISDVQVHVHTPPLEERERKQSKIVYSFIVRAAQP